MEAKRAARTTVSFMVKVLSFWSRIVELSDVGKRIVIVIVTRVDMLMCLWKKKKALRKKWVEGGFIYVFSMR